jgi:hypothetical protein
LNSLAEMHGPRGAAFDSIAEDIERIADYLDNELDPAAKGAFIVANHAVNVFVPLALGVALETRTTTGPIPALTQLAMVNDDHPLYGVLNADQKEAVLGLYSQAHLQQSVLVEGTGYPKSSNRAGGLSDGFRRGPTSVLPRLRKP